MAPCRESAQNLLRHWTPEQAIQLTDSPMAPWRPAGSPRRGRYQSLRRNALAIGAEASAPTPPPSTSTAKARSPRYPMNQACDGGLRPEPYSAVPVFPYTPDGKPTPAAVPLVTTARIIGRSVPSRAELSLRGWA